VITQLPLSEGTERQLAVAGIYCFVVPPLLGVGTLMLRTGAFEDDTR
jgi:hypothetical protein